MNTTFFRAKLKRTNTNESNEQSRARKRKRNASVTGKYCRNRMTKEFIWLKIEVEIALKSNIKGI